MKKDLLKGLSKEQLERARACKSSQELLALAKEEGVELSQEQLEAVNGGACIKERTPEHRDCPVCQSANTRAYYWDHSDKTSAYECLSCGHKWEEPF